MSVLLVAALAAGTAVAAILRAKVTVTADFGPGRGRVSVRSLWFRLETEPASGLTRGRVLGVPVRTRARRTRPRRQTEKPRPRRKPAGGWWRQREAVVAAAGRLARAVQRAWRAVHWEYFRAEVVVATPDPFLTGVAYGALCPLLALNHPPKTSLVITPDFTTTAPRAAAAFGAWFRPGALLAAVTPELLRMPWIKLIRLSRRVHPSVSGAG